MTTCIDKRNARRRLRFAVALVLGLLMVASGLAGCSSSSAGSGPEASASSILAGKFDTADAWQLVEQQVEVGQRPAGSTQLRKLAEKLRLLLPNGSLEPVPGEPGLQNVVGSLPGRQPAILVGAHYDTLAKPRGFVGANNGAAGTAVVVEAAQALEQMPRVSTPREVRFVLFDGEEPSGVRPQETGNFYKESLRGSKAYAAAHPGETKAAVVLDYVGNRGLHLPREANSTKSLWSRLLTAARLVGTSRYFSNKTASPIEDDHVPFLLEGVPAIDLIDWSYPGRSLADGLDKLSPESLTAVGATVVHLVNELERE